MVGIRVICIRAKLNGDRHEDQDIDVAACPDWDLVLATNWTGLQHDLKPEVEEEVLRATWEKQDGYGVPGLTPPQGWDWSAIRDSTPGAKRKMAAIAASEEARHPPSRVVGRDDGTWRAWKKTASHDRRRCDQDNAAAYGSVTRPAQKVLVQPPTSGDWSWNVTEDGSGSTSNAISHNGGNTK